jgi:hypothetical protein
MTSILEHVNVLGIPTQQQFTLTFQGRPWLAPRVSYLGVPIPSWLCSSIDIVKNLVLQLMQIDCFSHRASTSHKVRHTAQ